MMGIFDSLVHVPHHAQGNGDYGGAGDAAGAVGNDGTFRIQVDAHPQQGVDEAHAVSAGVLTGPGDFGDVRDIGSQLH